MLIPLPPQAQLQRLDPPATQGAMNGLPIIARAIVALPPPPTPSNGAIGEYPAPPEVMVLRFSGTITAWLDLERASPSSQAGNTVMLATPIIVADREAIHYQRAVSGFNANDYYVLKPTRDTLMWLYTDATSYRPMIEHLALQTP